MPVLLMGSVKGDSAYQQAVDAGYTGTEAAFYAALVTLKDAPFLPKSGGTMEGALNFGSGRAGVYASGALLRFDSDSVSVMELADGQVTLLDGNTTISGVCSPVLPKEAANKEYVDKKTLVFTDVTVTLWGFDSYEKFPGYDLVGFVPCPGLTPDYVPSVTFSPTDALSGDFAPVAQSGTDNVLIYCKAHPETITIPSIVCIKGA